MILSREYTLEACFLDDFLFPDSEDYPLTSPADSKFKPEFLTEYQDFFKGYISKLDSKHEQSVNMIENDFSTKLTLKDIPCHCSKCLVDFRSTLRDTIYTESVDLINEKVAEINELIDDHDQSALSVYRDLQKSH